MSSPRVRKIADSIKVLVAELLDPGKRHFLEAAGVDQVVGIGEVGGFLLAEALIGHDQARALLATFPDLGVAVDEVYWMGNEADGFSVSVRWSGVGTHRGYGLYGSPTGRRAQLWGMSQLYFSGGRVVEEWSLFNEFDVLAQLFADEPPAQLG